MTERGDIRNSPYAGRAKEYVWSVVSKVLPRGISPSDIDAAIEVNSCFLFVEGKTEGQVIPRGQQMFFRRLLYKLPTRSAAMLVAIHPALEEVNMATDCNRIKVAWRTEQGIQWSPAMTGGEVVTVVTRFSQDAETGSLRPEGWIVEQTPNPPPEHPCLGGCGEEATTAAGYCSMCEVF